RERRPDLRIGHFTHTPWAPPDYFALFPESVRREIVDGLLAADVLGFHTQRWVDAFLGCCEWTRDVKIAGNIVRSSNGRQTKCAVFPLGVDADELHERASRRDVVARRAYFEELIGG